MPSKHKEILDYFQNGCSQRDLDIITGIAHGESTLKYSDIDRYIKKCNKVATKFNNEYVKYNGEFTIRPEKHKFIFRYDKSDISHMMYTTIAQLRFFRWAIENKILIKALKERKQAIDKVTLENKIYKIESYDNMVNCIYGKELNNYRNKLVRNIPMVSYCDDITKYFNDNDKFIIKI